MKAFKGRHGVALAILILAGTVTHSACAETVKHRATHRVAHTDLLSASASAVSRPGVEVAPIAAAAGLHQLEPEDFHDSESTDRGAAVAGGIKPDGMTSSLAGLALIAFLIGRRSGTF